MTSSDLQSRKWQVAVILLYVLYTVAQHDVMLFPALYSRLSRVRHDYDRVIHDSWTRGSASRHIMIVAVSRTRPPPFKARL